MHISRSTRVTTFLLCLCAFMAVAIPAFAVDEDVTHSVVPVKTSHPWFYWPGWGYVALTSTVILLVLLAWWVKVLKPKYRGRKVTS